MHRLAPVAVFAALLALPLAACADASGGPKAVQVSDCSGRNSEPVQAIDGRYVYEAWIGCNAIAFSRSTNGGKTFGPSDVVKGSSQAGMFSWDPAIAVAADGTVYVAY